MIRTRIALVWAAGVALAAGAAAVADDVPKVADAIFKASALYGLPFSNASNESLGKLNDLVVDENGRILYGVMSHGGVAGVGDKLFAVPPEALKTLGDVPNNPDRKQFVVAVSKATLDGQPGFNEKDYPTSPSPLFVKGTPETTRRDAATSDKTMYRLRTLAGTAVRNQAGEDCGKMRDFGVHLRNGQVEYGILAYGGALRVGEKFFAAPWKALELKSLTGKPSDVSFVTRISKQTLEQSPGFDSKGFPSPTDLDLFKRDPSSK